jgi:large subunit ribosomal protein L10
LKGGETELAISKQRKEQLVSQYTEWIHRSQAMIVVEYAGLSMKMVDELRAKVREAGGEFHIVKNTLGSVAFTNSGLPQPGKLLEGSTAVVFAFQDAPAMAKAINEYTRTSDFVKVKGGYLEHNLITAQGVKALAELPPLPVMRAQLLGTLLAPASKLVRTLAEPARGLAAIFKAYSDKDSEPAAA